MRKFVLTLLFSTFGVVANSYSCGNSDAVWRGVNVGTSLSLSDFSFLKSINVNAIRVSFVNPSLFLDDGKLNDAATKVLDGYIDFARKNGIGIVVDFHAYPGGVKKFSGSPGDRIWLDPVFRKSVQTGFRQFADRYKNERYIVGVDVINEPAPSDKNEDIYDSFLRDVADVFKGRGYNIPILVQPPIRLGPTGVPSGQYKSVGWLSKFSGESFVKSIHYYEPGEFTHQGILAFAKKKGLPFPLTTQYGLKSYIDMTLAPLRAQGGRVVIGEFGASNYAGVQGDWYVDQLISVFESNGWGWFYHSFREADVWSPEVALDSEGKLSKTSDSPRLSVLKKFFYKNQSVVCDEK